MQINLNIVSNECKSVAGDEAQVTRANNSLHRVKAREGEMDREKESGRERVMKTKVNQLIGKAATTHLSTEEGESERERQSEREKESNCIAMASVNLW